MFAVSFTLLFGVFCILATVVMVGVSVELKFAVVFVVWFWKFVPCMFTVRSYVVAFHSGVIVYFSVPIPLFILLVPRVLVPSLYVAVRFLRSVVVEVTCAIIVIVSPIVAVIGSTFSVVKC